MLRTLLTTMMLLLVTLLSAQDTLKGKITGTIISAVDKKPMESTSVSLAKEKGLPPIKGTHTTAKGAFELAVPDTGTYVITITSTGFKEQVLRVRVGPDFTGWHIGTVTLQQGTGILAEVIIKTDRPLVEQRADRLIYNAEKDLSTLGGTAADVLRNVPMLSVDGDGNVQLRGSSNIRVLINNRPSSIIAVSVADALRQLPADMIKSVEVITSPTAKYDAEGSAGIINIITKKNLLQGLTGSVLIIPGNVSTIGNGGLNYRRGKWGLNFSASTNQFYNTGITYLERNNYTDGSTFIQDGKTKNRSGFISPRLGFDYTFDEHNSISSSFAYNPWHNQVKNNQLVTARTPGMPDRISNLQLLNKTTDVGYDMNFDYLRTFKDPQREFSFLTMYSITKSNNISNQDEFNTSKETVYLQRNLNKSTNKEATLQADYTHPVTKQSTLEIGGKTILRKASSDVSYRDIFPAAGTERTAQSIFSYHQDVWAGYLLYGFKAWNKVNLKMGGRFERTVIDADFLTKAYRFHTAYQNWIPSFNASYTFKEKHTLRAGYTQRLQRPQLYYLNPYREVVSPKIIKQGNPELDAEVAHLLELGYGTYAPKYSINASVFSRITNNAISSNFRLVDDTTYLNFLNIARNKTYGLSLSSNVKPVKALSLNGNVNLLYTELNGDGLFNSGWMYNVFVGYTLELGKGWWHNFTGSFNSRRVSLQGRIAAFYYHNTTIRKDVFNKRGSIGINLANPFMNGTRMRTNIFAATFNQVDDVTNYTRGIRLNLQYRFGNLQQQKAPRKPKKVINNDDALRN